MVWNIVQISGTAREREREKQIQNYTDPILYLILLLIWSTELKGEMPSKCLLSNWGDIKQTYTPIFIII